MVRKSSGKHKETRAESLAKLPTEMQIRLGEFEFGLHGVRDNTKADYLARMVSFGSFLIDKGKRSFEEAKRQDIDLFLSGYKNPATKNVFIAVFRHFYSSKPELISHLKVYEIDLEEITPSEILTPQEVISLAVEAGKKREMYKYIILTLFESCARISELLNLRIGDCVFSSVTDKEGKRKLIATLHFKRSKGGVRKQPVVLVMFSTDLQRWVDSQKTTEGYLFPSPSLKDEPISCESVETALWNAGQRLNMKKRLNPHWLRHSGLSYFANQKNYNEQLLMWRAGWVNTDMARRYIHSGAELEAKAYLERMGYQVEGKTEDKKILPKTCPHCQALNPYTNDVCDLCAMPLDLTLYKAEIERRRNIEQLALNISNLADEKLTPEQQTELKKRTDTCLALLELGRDDLAREYISKLLEHWTKMFLTS